MGHLNKLRGDFARKLVIAQVQYSQPRQVAQFHGNIARKPVIVQVQYNQIRQVAQLRGDPAFTSGLTGHGKPVIAQAQ